AFTAASATCQLRRCPNGRSCGRTRAGSERKEGPDMKRRARTHSGTGRLMAVLVVLAMVPLGLLAYSTVRLSTGAVNKEVKARIRTSASLSAAALQKEIQGVADLVESYADRPTLVAALSDAAQYDQSQIQFQLEELA